MRKEMLFLKVVKSKYQQVLFLLLPHYYEVSGNLAYLFLKF